MNDKIEKRRHPRVKSDGVFRVYTSVSTCKYSVRLSDISRSGAFIRTPHIPKMGEIVTYTIVDDITHEDRFIGNAVVKWIKNKNCNEDEMGFGIELEKELADEILEELASKA